MSKYRLNHAPGPLVAAKGWPLCQLLFQRMLEVGRFLGIVNFFVDHHYSVMVGALDVHEASRPPSPLMDATELDLTFTANYIIFIPTPNSVDFRHNTPFIE